MRNAILATAMARALAAGPLRATRRKNPPADVGPVGIAWFDITTTNLPQSKEFYGKHSLRRSDHGFSLPDLEREPKAIAVRSHGSMLPSS